MDAIEVERKPAQHDRVAGFDLGFSHLFTVHERAVAAAEVGDHAVVAVNPETYVAAGNAGIVDGEVADRGPSDHRVTGSKRVPATAPVP